MPKADQKAFDYRGHKIEIGEWAGDLKIDGDSMGYTNSVVKLNQGISWVTTESGSYQGEWYALGHGVNDTGTDGWWFHSGSYGSCSGCDWLQGISTEEEVVEFLKEMQKINFIGKDIKEAMAYIETMIAQEDWNDSRKEALNELIIKVTGLID